MERNKQSFLSLGVALCALLYIALFTATLAPYRGTVDTHYFKDPGSNLATGSGMTAAYNYGNFDGVKELYAGYPPGLPLLFGAYGSLAGISPVSNSVFELLVSGAIAVVLARLLLPLFPLDARRHCILLAIALLAAIPARYVVHCLDRPDGVGLLLALSALLPDASHRSGLRLGALLTALAALTSFINGLLAGLGLIVVWILAPAERRLPLQTMAATALLFALVPWAAALGILHALDGTYLGRLFGFVGAHTGSLLLEGGIDGTLAILVRGSGMPSWWLFYGTAAVGLLGSSASLLGSRAVSLHRRVVVLILIWTTAVVAALLVPWDPFYPALAAGLFLPAIAVGLPAVNWTRPWSRVLLLMTLGGMLLLRSALEGPTLVRLASMRDSYDRITHLLDSRPLSDRNGDGEIWVAAAPTSYFVYKSRGYEVLPLDFPPMTAAEALRVADYASLPFGGGGDPFKPWQPLWWPEFVSGLEVVFRPELPQIVTILGWRLSNSSYSWEDELWQRRP